MTNHMLTRRALGVALLSLTLGASVAFADEGGPVPAAIGTAGGYEGVLLDGRGLALYAFTNDTDGASTCYDNCAENWPPVLADGLQGEGIDVALVGTTQRRDGSNQVTYGGFPLYRFAADQAGMASGQGVGERWFLVSATGELVPVIDVDDAGEAAADEAAPEPSLEALLAAGGPLYASTCAACHGAEGQGGVGPRLDGNGNLRGALGIVGPILWGFPPAMPAFGGQFSDEEVAAIATYVRNSWSNEFGGVMPREVANRR